MISAMLQGWSILSNQEKTRVHFHVGNAQSAGHQASRIDCLSQVDGEWNKYLYKTALDWMKKELPAEISNLVVDYSPYGIVEKGKWRSFFTVW